jgi:simple sugar transport system ATP-binding protein
LAVALIELRNIWKSFAGAPALQDVSLSVERGEILGLIGDNGAGKSTLLKIMAGNYPPDRGSIQFEGEEIRFRSAAEARRCGIETVYQHLALCNNLTAAENVFLGRELYNGLGPLRLVDRAAMEARTRELLARLKSDTPAGDLVGTMSRGQRQAVAIARALLTSPKLLLMDEPVAALSPRQTGELLALLRELRSRNIAVVFVSHSLSDVFAIADRIILLRGGRKLLDAPTSKLSLGEVTALLGDAA